MHSRCLEKKHEVWIKLFKILNRWKEDWFFSSDKRNIVVEEGKYFSSSAILNSSSRSGGFRGTHKPNNTECVTPPKVSYIFTFAYIENFLASRHLSKYKYNKRQTRNSVWRLGSKCREAQVCKSITFAAICLILH